MWNVPLRGNFIELSSAIPARHSIVRLLISWHRRRWHWTTSASTPTTASRLPESDRLPGCGEHRPELVRLRFPLGDRLGRLLLLYLFVNGFAAASKTRLLSINLALVSCIEHSALLTEDFLAYILMPS